MDSIKNYYPFQAMRPGIQEAFDVLDANEDKKFIFIRGRTGVGKSGISVALSRKWNGHILTATKLLQDQYTSTKEFDIEFALKGKSNYRCCIANSAMADAPCASRSLLSIGKRKYDIAEKITTPAQLKDDCVAKQQCEYYEKRSYVKTAGGGFLNYDFALSNKLGGDSIILDEAHNFIDKMLDFYSLEISRKKLKSMINVDDVPNQTNYCAWLDRVKKLASLKAEVASDTKTREQITNIKEKCASILEEQPLPGDYFVDIEADKIVIKPLKPKLIVNKFFKKFNKIFFLSATMDESFPQILGINPKEMVFLSIDGGFPPEYRPVYFPKDIPNINYQTKIVDDLPNIKVLNAVLAAHNGQKGIIHTGNYRIFTALQSIYGLDERFTWVEQGADKGAILKAHAEMKESILVSPSMIEGVDLADDLARWQVIFKVPYPAKSSYQDALEEALPGLYQMSTRNALVQAYGRPVRSATDWASTYILDGSFKMILGSIDTYLSQAVKRGEWEKLIQALTDGKIPTVLKE